MHTLPKLPYNYDSLEPYIDQRTMELHHSKHHQGYVDKLNAALEGYSNLQQKTVDELLMNLKEIPQEIRQLVINNGGGHSNHSLFWQLLRPVAKLSETEQQNNQPQGELANAIESKWGFEKFQDEFSQTAAGQFGSGWGWLVLDASNQLQIISTSNQDSPLSEGLKPLLTVDVWEHAYYLKYQNRRAEYLDNFWAVINWSKVEELFLQAK